MVDTAEVPRCFCARTRQIIGVHLRKYICPAIGKERARVIYNFSVPARRD